MTGINKMESFETEIEQLQQEQEMLSQAVVAVLIESVLDNVGQLNSRRRLPGIAARIVEVALDYMAGQMNDEDLAIHLMELIEMGLRNRAALAVADSLVNACASFFPDDSSLQPRLVAYRHGFLHGYMETMNEYVTREREAVYENMGAAIETQIKIERDLRHHLEEQQQQLTRYTAELEAVAEISSTAANILEEQLLLKNVADLTKEKFQLYHVHIYRFDKEMDLLQLVAGSGKIGETMVTQGWQITLGQKQSLVARAAREQTGVIVNDVQAEADFLANQLLPNTRAELAIPLMAQDKLLGVLDIQSDKPDTFQEQELRIMAILATQIGIAWQNARSFERSEAALHELNEVTRQLTREGWQEFLQANEEREMRYAYDLQELFTPENGRSTLSSTLQQSIVVQGTEIGQLWLDEPQTLTEDAADIVNAVVERLGLHIENLRLSTQTQIALSETETQAERLEMLNILGAELSSAQSTDDLFQATARHTAAILNADRASLTLLKPEEQMLELFSLEGAAGAIPVGSQIPLEGTAAGAAITSNRIINTPDTRQSEFTAVPELTEAGILSTLNVPLTTQSGVLGTLNVGSQHPHAFDSRAENLLRQIASLLASTIERQNLFEQTQAALSETATLYDLSARLNAATTANEITQALAQAGQADSATLMTLHLDRQEQPERLQIAASWPALEGIENSVDLELSIEDYPSSHLWLSSPDEPVFIADRDNDERLDENSRLALAQFGLESMIWLPLHLNKKWLGMVAISWEKKRNFSERERRIYQSLMGQAAVVVNQLQLLQQTQERATQLEELTELEALLSQASDETDLLSVILNISQSPSRASLYHIEADGDGTPLTAHLAARWQAEHMETVAVRAEQSVQELIAAAVWTQNPNRVFLTGDIAQDERLDEAARQGDATTLAALPLHSGGRWHGVVLLEWEQPHAFAEKEEFLLRQMLEPVSAVLASQRALATTESLYQASARLNTVQTYEEILDVLREFTIAGRGVSLVSLNLFDRPWSGQQKPEWIESIAYWSSFTPQREATTFRLADYASAEAILRPDQAMFVTNIQTDERIDENARNLFVRGYQATSALFVPLVTANQWRGYVSAFYSEETAFPEAEIRQTMVLAAQAAVAVQSLQLLRQTEQQLTNLTNIQQTTASLAGALSFDDALSTFLQQICQSVGADSADMYELEGQVVNRIGIYPLQPDKPVQFSCTLDKQPMMQQAVTSRRAATLSVQDRTLDESLRRSFADAGIMSNATIPLIGRTGTFGILSVNREQAARQFDEQDLNLLQTLSDQAMIAFERVQLLEEATRRAEYEQRLREITTRVRGSIDVDTIMRTAVQEVGRVLGRRTFIYLGEEADNGREQPEDQAQIVE